MKRVKEADGTEREMTDAEFRALPPSALQELRVWMPMSEEYGGGFWASGSKFRPVTVERLPDGALAIDW